MVSAGVPDELFSLTRRPGDFLLYFGRLDIFHKGLDVLLPAMAIIVKKYPSLVLKMAGRGKDADAVVNMAKDLGIAGNVEMLGAVSDAERNDLLASAKLQFMPSRFEGFGLAAAEAMAAGVPLVASSAGSLPEVVDAPRGGVLVPPGDPAALAQAALRLLEDDIERDALSRSARESARRFSWASVADAHLDFIHHIAAAA